ncbi:MAG: shikimate kinase [Alphaproteobacteria bacterium]
MAVAHSSKMDRIVVLVGLMGAGKTCIGKRLAQRLGLPFVDADSAIEEAAGCTIPEIFAQHGEEHFRDGERRVIARLLDDPPHVLSTGGGAYMDPSTRSKIRERGISIWLRASLDILMRRTARRNNRPLLKRGSRRETLQRLMEERYPIYGEADITIDSADAPADETVDKVMAALEAYLARTRKDAEGPKERTRKAAAS